MISSHNKKKMRIWLPVFLLLMAGASAQAVAQEAAASGPLGWIQDLENSNVAQQYRDFKSNLKSKGWKLSPFFKTRVDYTSNVFFANDGKGDAVWYETPGLVGNYNDRSTDFNFGYQADFDYYSKYSSQNAQNQDFFVNGMRQLNENWYVQGGEKLKQYQAVSGDSLQKHLDIFENTTNAAVGYIQGDWTFQTGYEYFMRNYLSALADRFDMHQNKFDELIYYRMNPEWRFFTGYRMGFINYGSIPTHNSTWFEIPVGVETQLPWDIQMNGSLGIHRRNVQSEGKNDFTFLIGDLDLSKKLSEKTSASVGFYRHPEETNFENQILYDEKAFYGNLTHWCSSNLRSKSGVAWGQRDFQEDSFLGPRFLVGNTLFVSQGDIRTRHDQFLNLSTGADYWLASWWSVNLQYRFEWRGSNVDYFDATEHRVSAGSTFNF